MDNQRLLIWATFGFLLWITWQTWQEDYATPPADVAAPPGLDIPAEADDTPPAMPAADVPTDPSTDADSPPALSPAEPDQAPSVSAEPDAASIMVSTDVLDIRISTRGGTLTHAVLKDYPVAKDRPDELVELLTPSPNQLGQIRTGLNDDGDAAKADHNAIYETARTSYDMGSADELIVPLTWSNDAGVTVEKTLRFTRGSYRIDVSHRVINNGTERWRGAEYGQIRRRSFELERSMFDVDSYSFDGPIIYDGDKAEKLDRDDLMDDGPFQIDARNGWVASIQHHFLSALVPPADASYSYSVRVRDSVATSTLIAAEASVVAPGSEHTFDTTLFVGPKLQTQLEEIADSMPLTVDYGILNMLSKPLFDILTWIYGLVANWGVAIIVVTILIKLVFYKLTEKSGRSMAKMREIQPRMQALQDRYKDDRQALSQAMMELYKREKVNPAAGCLPILIQMPFFLAFYWVLLESVEMRQAPFALWITDLSSRDPYFILPLIMGAAMLFQQKLNPAPPDPVQARVMQIMPIMFTVFFAFFPSGLVLYWVTNTLLSIAQQWYINKLVHEEAAAKKGHGKKKSKAES